VALRDAIAAGIKVADGVTRAGGLQALVTLRHAGGADGEGTIRYAPPLGQPATPMRAIVDWTQRSLRTQQGQMSVSRAQVSFLDVAALLAATGGEGLSDDDIITLPDGTTGPILDMKGFIDGGTGQPFMTEAFLG
jgi:hypothetical protein